MRSVFLVCTIVVWICLSVTKSFGDSSCFDVCDVSFLIPPSERSIKVSGDENHRSLLSRELFYNFDDFIKRGHPQLTPGEVYEHLIVTGIRFDPCGPKYPEDWDLSKCVLPNIRIIAQVYKDGRTTNAALHMVFLLRPLSDLSVVNGRPQPTVVLDPKMRDSLISKFATMKSRNFKAGILTNGVATGIHPVFSSKNAAPKVLNEFEADLRAIFDELCDESRYFFTAVMFTDETFASQNEGKERWVWQKANIDRSTGKIVFHFGGIPGFDPKLREQSFTADRGKRSGATVSPSSNLPVAGVKNSSIEAILNRSDRIDRDDVSDAIHATDRLDNPDHVLVQTDDCVSCHLTTTAREYALHSIPDLKLDRDLKYSFLVDSKLTDSLDEHQLSLQKKGGYKIASFSFFDGKPSVSDRTVNESLQAAHVVNLLRK